MTLPRTSIRSPGKASGSCSAKPVGAALRHPLPARGGSRCAGGFVSKNLSALHDEPHMLGGRDVLQHVARNRHEIGFLPRLDRSDDLVKAEERRRHMNRAKRGCRRHPVLDEQPNSCALSPCGLTAESVPKAIFTPAFSARSNAAERAASAACAFVAISGG